MHCQLVNNLDLIIKSDSPDFLNNCLLYFPATEILGGISPQSSAKFIHDDYTLTLHMSDIVTCRLTDDVRQMVLVPAVVVPGVRLKQVVPGGELEGHAGRAPDVCRGSVTRPDDDLQGPVLPSLNVVCEVMMLPAGVTQVSDLDTQGRTLVTHGVLKQLVIKRHAVIRPWSHSQ